MVAFKEPVATGAVQVVLELLCHKFPNVRKVAAEKLYVKVLTYEEQFAEREGEEVDIDEALEVLTETGWDAEDVRAGTTLPGHVSLARLGACVRTHPLTRRPLRRTCHLLARSLYNLHACGLARPPA